MINEQISKTLCTGCSACYAVCPVNAIYLKKDSNGFGYPEVNAAECIKCGLCIQSCPLQKRSIYEEKGRGAFAVISNDEKNRYLSTSGGVFTEIARLFLAEGGVVVGAAYNERHFVEHILIESIDDLWKLRQSKYLESNKKNIFRETKKHLENGEKVFFVGVPCEIAGLVSYLGKEYDNLFACDLICRGNNSPFVFQKYLEWLENKYNSKVKRVWFKNKKYTWNRFSTRVDFMNGNIYQQDRYHDLYMRGYLEANLFIRQSCENCHFKKDNRYADITLADFWGVENHFPDLDTQNGVSLVITNNCKGKKILESIKSHTRICECDYWKIATVNKAYVSSVVRNVNTESFYKDLKLTDFDKAIKKYLSSYWGLAIRRQLRSLKMNIKKGISTKVHILFIKT